MEPNKKKELIEYLRTESDGILSWIYRKEIAAWASVVLYFTSLFGIYNVVNDISGSLIYSLVLIFFVILFTYLFLLFLYKQYGSLVNGMANNLANSFWISKLIQDESTVDTFVFEISDANTIPKSIKDAAEQKYGSLRQCKIWKKLLIPFLLLPKLFCIEVKEYNNIEVQESVLYDMIILSTIFLVLYIITNINSSELCLHHCFH
jgi:hypothetical protein